MTPHRAKRAMETVLRAYAAARSASFEERTVAAERLCVMAIRDREHVTLRIDACRQLQAVEAAYAMGEFADKDARAQAVLAFAETYFRDNRGPLGL
jgi:hypothetical protein